LTFVTIATAFGGKPKMLTRTVRDWERGGGQG